MRRKGVHNVFHVALLLKAPKDQIPGRKPIQPPPVIVDSEEELEVKEILDSRMFRNQLQYLVRWEGTTAEEDSWEPAGALKNAPDAVMDFHNSHPEAPRRIGATVFAALQWRPLENYTIHNKKEEVRRILHSRDLVP